MQTDAAPTQSHRHLLAQKVNCAVINAGDGRREHPTQALLDALTIRRHKGKLHRLNVAICGDILHSRVARSNIHLLNKMESRVRVIAPPTLLPRGIEQMGAEVFHDMAEGLEGCDVVMMLRLQQERMGRDRQRSGRQYQPLRHCGAGRDGGGGAYGGTGNVGAEHSECAGHGGGWMTRRTLDKSRDGNTLVLATHNKGKVREILDLVGPYGFEVISVGELGLPVPVEDGMTFIENASLRWPMIAGLRLMPCTEHLGFFRRIGRARTRISRARWSACARNLLGAARATVRRRILSRR